MEIDCREKIRARFFQLEARDIFIPFPNGKLYIRVDDSRFPKSACINAVCLTNGRPESFAPDEQVIVFTQIKIKY